MKFRPAPPACLFFGVITGDPALFPWIAGELERRFGELESSRESPVYPFPETRTYARTMGADLERKFFFLRERFPQDDLARVKHLTLEIEAEARDLPAARVERPVNIDPGILNDCRIILASTKDHAHRLYRGDGIYEEVTLRFVKGEYRPFEWTYPDFRSKAYHAHFEAIRRDYLDEIRGVRR